MYENFDYSTRIKEDFAFKSETKAKEVADEVGGYVYRKLNGMWGIQL